MPSKTKKYTPPFPTSPEILRNVAKHLGTKSVVSQKTSNQLDDYVRKGYYIYETHNRLLREAIIDPLRDLTSYDFATQAEKCLEQLFSQYHNLIVTRYVGGLSRKEIAPFLLDFFSSRGVEALKDLTRKIDTPEIPSWLIGVKLLPLTLKWLPDNYDGYRDALNKYLDPLSAKHIPKLKSIKTMTKELSLAENLTEKEIQEISSILIIARTVDSIAKQYKDQPIHEKLTQEPSIFKASADHFCALHSANPSPFLSANHPARLAIELMSKGQLSDGELVIVKKHLVAAKKAHKNNKLPHSLNYLLFWGEAKYVTIAGDKSRSLALYEKAFMYSLYTAGDEQCQIIKEALAVAAMCDANRSIFKKLKNQAVAFKFYHYFQKNKDYSPTNDETSQTSNSQKHIPQGNKTSRTQDNIVEDWEIESWKDRFFELFPNNRWGLKEADIPIVIADENIVDPDPRYPNREIQISIGKPRKMPQLVFFAMRKNGKAVEELLNAGADVLSLSKNGESALLMALATKTPDSLSQADKKLIQLLLQHIRDIQITNGDCSVSKMINTPDIMKQYTPLGYAVDSGEADIIQSLIELGASVDQKFGLEQTTPLYSCINHILLAKNYRETLTLSILMMPQSDFDEMIRRYPGKLPDHYRNNRQEILHDPKFEQFARKCSNIDRIKFIAVTKTLLENGASPNTPLAKKLVPESTPLIDAITHNDTELFQLLMQHGGDPNRSCHMLFNQEKCSCETLAKLSGSQDILKFLRDYKDKKTIQ